MTKRPEKNNLEEEKFILAPHFRVSVHGQTVLTLWASGEAEHDAGSVWQRKAALYMTTSKQRERSTLSLCLHTNHVGMPPSDLLPSVTAYLPTVATSYSMLVDQSTN